MMMRFDAAWLMCMSLLLVSCQRRQAAGPPQASEPARSPTTSVAVSRPDPVANTQPSTRILQPFPDITVVLDPITGSRVEIKAWTCLDEGLLEQVACSPQTREHESLVVVKAEASQVHAALLLADFEPGSPGVWTYDEGVFGTVDPTGELLDVAVRYLDASGRSVEHPVGHWIRRFGAAGPIAELFPAEPWVFGGSKLVPNPQFMGPGEHYVADMTGSIIGLVTFGDEVVGFWRVFADQESVQAPIWEVNPETVPPPRTEVTLVLRKWAR